MDIASESPATRHLYSIDDPTTREFGTRCLLARRMIESGVRFVQLYSGDTNGWDAHENVMTNHSTHCARCGWPAWRKANSHSIHSLGSSAFIRKAR